MWLMAMLVFQEVGCPEDDFHHFAEDIRLGQCFFWPDKVLLTSIIRSKVLDGKAWSQNPLLQLLSHIGL